MFLYISVPNCKVKVIYALIGGSFSSFLFECAKRIFTIYIREFPTYKIIYGSLAAIPLFLVWLYIGWLIILLGVQVTYILQSKVYKSEL